MIELYNKIMQRQTKSTNFYIFSNGGGYSNNTGLGGMPKY